MDGIKFERRTINVKLKKSRKDVRRNCDNEKKYQDISNCNSCYIVFLRVSKQYKCICCFSEFGYKKALSGYLTTDTGEKIKPKFTIRYK